MDIIFSDNKCYWCRNVETTDSTVLSGCLNGHIHQRRMCKMCRPIFWRQYSTTKVRCRHKDCNGFIVDWVTITDKRNRIQATFGI